MCARARARARAVCGVRVCGVRCGVWVCGVRCGCGCGCGCGCVCVCVFFPSHLRPGRTPSLVHLDFLYPARNRGRRPGRFWLALLGTMLVHCGLGPGLPLARVKPRAGSEAALALAVKLYSP